MSKKEKVVVDQSGITADQMKDFWRMVAEGTINRKIMQWISENIAEIREKAGTKWWDEILEKEHQCHEDFFGREYDLSTFEAVLKKHGATRIKNWQNRGFEPHYLPLAVMSKDADIPCWKIRPEEWYYSQVAKSKILRCQSNGQLRPVDEVKLEGIVVLLDTRLKPKYNNGKQMFFQDTICGAVIAMLREQGNIANYDCGDQTSRFGVSAQEWQEHIRPALAKEFGVETDQVRLETSIEANVIPQLYSYMPRHKDGETNTWVWYEEYFEDVSDRLDGGDSDCGGLSDVNYYSVGCHWSSGAVRPLVVLS